MCYQANDCYAESFAIAMESSDDRVEGGYLGSPHQLAMDLFGSLTCAASTQWTGHASSARRLNGDDPPRIYPTARCVPYTTGPQARRSIDRRVSMLGLPFDHFFVSRKPPVDIVHVFLIVLVMWSSIRGLRNLQVHHQVFRSQPGDDVERNLIALV
jgi:hypothetical protein